MTKRLPDCRVLAVLFMALMVLSPILAGTALPAVAVEDVVPEGGEVEGPPSIDEIGTDVARSEGFFPAEYTSPTWFQWLLFPTIIVAVIMALALLLYYLFRQPSFAAERQKSKSGK